MAFKKMKNKLVSDYAYLYLFDINSLLSVNGIIMNPHKHSVRWYVVHKDVNYFKKLKLKLRLKYYGLYPNDILYYKSNDDNEYKNLSDYFKQILNGEHKELHRFERITKIIYINKDVSAIKRINEFREGYNFFAVTLFDMNAYNVSNLII